MGFLGEGDLKRSVGDGGRGVLRWSYSCLLSLSLGRTCCESDHLSFWLWGPREILKVAPFSPKARTSGKGEAKSERCFLPISELIPESP